MSETKRGDMGTVHEVGAEKKEFDSRMDGFFNTVGEWKGNVEKLEPVDTQGEKGKVADINFANMILDRRGDIEKWVSDCMNSQTIIDWPALMELLGASSEHRRLDITSLKDGLDSAVSEMYGEEEDEDDIVEF